MDKRLNILHLRASNFVGGPEKQILEHLRRIDSKRFWPMLCSFTTDGQSNELIREGSNSNIPSFNLNSRFTFDPRLIKQLRNLLTENSVHILVTHGYKSNIIGYFSVKNLKIPMIVYSHGWTGECATVRCYEFIDRQIMKRVSDIVAVSEGHKRQLVKVGIPSERITVVQNAVQIREKLSHTSLRTRYSLPNDAKLVVSAGRLSIEKNFSGLIEAATPILKKQENIFFLVFGEGGERQELERQVIGAGLQGRFLFPGFVDDVPSLLSDADIFVSSSHTEGLPVAVLEGAAAGLPVVATAVGGTPEVVRDGYNGMLVGPGDMSALGRAIEHLLENPVKAKIMGGKGIVLVNQFFDFGSHTKKLETLYERI